MDESSTVQPQRRAFGRTPTIRRFHSNSIRPTRSPLINLVIVTAAIVVFGFLVYQFLFDPGRGVYADVIDFSKSIEQIQELSTVKSHLRFAVVVREEGGNIVVRHLADQAKELGMSDVSSMLFQDPTMIVELHGIATYGMRLNDLQSRVQQTDSSVRFRLGPAEVLDVKLVAADTRIVAQMKGLFRSSGNQLLLEANRHGEQFVAEMARQDTMMAAMAEGRARELLALLVERAGRKAEFVK